MFKKLFLFLISHIPNITIPDNNGNPYLTRYYLFGADRLFGNIFIHHFWASDKDVSSENGSLLTHCHPFNWSFSFILCGGYCEERHTINGNITSSIIRPFSFNYISNKIFHRVDLLDEQNGAWSIFVTGCRSKDISWGFYDRITKQYKDFKEFPKAIA